MNKYSVTSTSELRNLCIKNNWFTAGTIEQYDKLFYANENCRSTEVLDILITEKRKGM